jgi:hypothetical protein
VTVGSEKVTGAPVGMIAWTETGPGHEIAGKVPEGLAGFVQPFVSTIMTETANFFAMAPGPSTSAR